MLSDSSKRIPASGRGPALRGSIIAAFTVILVAISVLGIVRSMDSGSARRSLLPGQTPADGVTATPELAPRFMPAVAAAGEELFVFGGLATTGDPDKPRQLQNDGALLRPGSNETKPLSTSPFDPPLDVPAAVTVGNSVVVVGVSCKTTEPPEGASIFCDPANYAAGKYDIASSSWHEVVIPKALSGVKNGVVQALGSTADGRAVFALGERFAEVYWTFSPEKDEWTQLPSPAVRPEDVCLAKDQLLVLSSRFSHNDEVLEDDPSRHVQPGETFAIGANDHWVEPSLAIFDIANPSKGWRQSEPAPEYVSTTSTAPQLECLGDAAMVLDPVFPTLNSRIYALATDKWSSAVAGPSPDFFRDRVWTGKELVFLPTEAKVGNPGLAYDPGRNTWRTLASVPPVTRQPQWNGSAIVGYAEPLPALRADVSALSQPDLNFETGIFQVIP